MIDKGYMRQYWRPVQLALEEYLAAVEDKHDFDFCLDHALLFWNKTPEEQQKLIDDHERRELRKQEAQKLLDQEWTKFRSIARKVTFEGWSPGE